MAAMSGAGSVTIGQTRHDLPQHGAIFLPKQIPHAVFNTGETPLVVLVHHLKTTR
ncbi:MAG: cupin domain-containing protein [Myxococcales bacterium]|nr:cupin domain-containing protein [Myxococcales bacterium]